MLHIILMKVNVELIIEIMLIMQSNVHIYKLERIKLCHAMSWKKITHSF